ncbi:hypothetical protein MMC25_001991 [Agyrium rufum]|nr:hypothetical protein [Agyrium rufum]
MSTRLEPAEAARTTCLPAGSKQDDLKVKSAESRQHGISHVLGAFPECQPSSFTREGQILQALVEESERIEVAKERYDSTKGDLLALGRIHEASDDHKRTRSIDVAACVCGANGEDVRIAMLTSQYFTLEGNPDNSFRTHSFKESEQGFWCGPGDPVRQLCFSAQADRPGALLAVRNQRFLTILQPELKQKYVPPSVFSEARGKARYAASKVDANCLLSMSAGDLGLSTLADVSFNPWYDQQVAVIDDQGKWTLYELRKEHRKYNVDLIAQSILESSNHSEDSDPSVYNVVAANAKPDKIDEKDDGIPISDGWARVLWVSNFTTLLVCNRNAIAIYDFKGGNHTMKSSQPKSVMKVGSGQILDVRRSDSDFSSVFVLSTDKVCLLRVRNSQGSDEDVANPPAQLELVWRHYRNPFDMSMQICFKSVDRETHILLRSSLTSLITTFHLKQITTTGRWTVYGPYLFKWSIEGSSKKSPKAMLFTGVLDTKTEIQQGETTNSSTDCTNLLHLLILQDTYEVQENVLYDQRRGKVRIRWTRQPRQHGRHLLSSQVVDEDEDFLVHDMLLSEDEEWVFPVPPPYQGKRQFQVGNGKFDPFTLSLEWLAQEIEQPNESSHDVREPEPDAFKAELQNCWAEVDDRSQDSHSLQLMNELVDNNAVPRDLELASRVWTDHVTELTESNGGGEAEKGQLISLGFSDVPGSSLFAEHALYHGSLAELHRHGIITRWITPLSSDVLPRTRVNLEKRMRTVSVDLFLSSRAMEDSRKNQNLDNSRVVTATEADLSSSTEIPLPTFGNLSIRSKNQGETAFTSSINTIKNQSSKMQTPVSGASSSLDNVYFRLASLTSLDSQDNLPAAATRVLSHWSPGADPGEYNWQQSNAALAAATSGAETAGEDEKARRNRLRKEKRLKARQDAGLLVSSTQPLPERSRHLISPTGSQPVAVPRLLDSSQPGTKSEVERGPFGGRKKTSGRGLKKRDGRGAVPGFK